MNDLGEANMILGVDIMINLKKDRFFIALVYLLEEYGGMV